MLYKLSLGESSGLSLSAVPFYDFSVMNAVEKDLEALFATHLIDRLFEEAPLLPIFRERQWQPEADLYALNGDGDLVIFEFKRGKVGGEAVHQVLRYAQEAGRWTFETLAQKYRTFLRTMAREECALEAAHRDAFELPRALRPEEFNRRQHLWLVGNAADDELINSVDYWHRQGLSIRFVPYRVYSIGDQHYFEVFSPPYDRHSNPADVKGVLFDTNRSYDENAIWHMIEKKRVSAFGDVKTVAEYLKPKDLVFLSHKGYGLVAAAEVLGPTKSDGDNECYHDVRFLTKVPSRPDGIAKCMSFSAVATVTSRSFFWARTVKVPYLTAEEAKHLLTELQKILGET